MRRSEDSWTLTTQSKIPKEVDSNHHANVLCIMCITVVDE